MLGVATSFANGRVRFGFQAMVAVAVAVIASAAVPARGATETVVNWGGNYGSKNFNYTADRKSGAGVYGGDPADYRDYRPFYDDDPLYCLSALTVYSGPRFYGGFDAYNYDAPATPFYALVNSAGTGSNYIRFSIHPSQFATSGAGALAVVFVKDDFVGNIVKTAPQIYMDSADSSISITNSVLSGFTGRFIIRNGSTYYLSESTFSTQGQAVTLTNPSTSTHWAAFDPHTNLMVTGGTFNPVHFTDVTAAGFYISNPNIAPTATSTFNMTAFSLTATDIAAVAPVPLPPAFAVGATLLATVVAVRLRNRRASRRNA